MVSLLDFSLLCYTMKYRRTFAVFAKVPSQREYSPNIKRLYSPSNAVLNPLIRWSVGRLFGALSGRWGSAQ